jgi:hypothetical protein
MTTQAPPLEQQKHSTAPVDASSDELEFTSLALLDHRTQSRAVTLEDAPPGHYLALEDQLIPLEDKITHLGRGITAHIRFEDRRVSRDHAILVRHGRYMRVLDNRSANGTFLNGRRVIATTVRDRDVIRLGPIALQYVEVSRGG